MSLQNFTLLFVEDDPQIQELMKAILKEEVKTFYQAYNGEEGLAFYMRKKPDIVLTDINMPLLDGMQMSKKIKEIDHNQPILIMSAFDEKEILLNAIDLGVDGFIVKPVNMIQLTTKLDRIVKKLEHRNDTGNTRLKELGKKQEEIQNLYNLAHYDTLTGIPNRYLFNKKINQAIVKAERRHTQFALFFIDIDNFKSINDTYGHKAGDKVLVHLVQSIRTVIQEKDTLARIGGDEFALIVDNAGDRNAIELLAKKMIHAISKPVSFGNGNFFISCSIGISRYPHDTSCKEELVHFADLAMYQVKSTGKSDFGFYEAE